ncbi:MAG: DUF255 domain-containing protein [Saprospiraceae bacterium]|nr:DUF255 domain-containing protein [Bacteroidia bacterium]MBT8229123.1 DUF255 domain-containing protein [Bacteroidia bacterium]NNF21252.1 DUF255 domain-containing protein [Saprospiraceae bacterium]
MIVRFIILFLFLAANAHSQSGVNFKELPLDEALELAKKQNKKIFIDTYTPACKPCKKMDIEFRNKDLANYFNENFINVKVNMNGPLANAYNSKFSVIFLPTLFIVTPEGYTTLRVEHIISAKDLLQFGMQSNKS